MNLASRCREAITQAATLKKELSLQKKKTAEAVAQTVAVIEQLKKMQRQQKLSVAALAAEAPPTLTSLSTNKAPSKPAAVVSPSAPEEDLSPTDSMTHSESSDADEIVVVETPAVVVDAAAEYNDDSTSCDTVDDAPATVASPTSYKHEITDAALECPAQSYSSSPVSETDSPTESKCITDAQQTTPEHSGLGSTKDPPLITPSPTGESAPIERETKGLTVDDIIEQMDAEEALELNLLMSDGDIAIDTTTADVLNACDDSDDILEVSGVGLNFTGAVEEEETNADGRENVWLSVVSAAVSEARGLSSHELPPASSPAAETGLVSSDDFDEVGVSMSGSSEVGFPVENGIDDDEDSQRAVKGSKDDLPSTGTSHDSNAAPLLSFNEKDLSTAAGSPLRKALSSLLHKKDRTVKGTKSTKKERKGSKMDSDKEAVASVPTVQKLDVPVIENRDVDRVTSKSLSTFDPVVELSKRPVTLTEDLANMVRESKTDDLWREDFDEAAETQDIITSLHSDGPVQKNYFSDPAEPKILRTHPNAKFPRVGGPFNEEMPSDMIQKPHRSGRAGTLGSFQKDENDGVRSSLLSSIDAFEASFSTSFPESFATTERESALAKVSTSVKAASDIAIYNPFDTDSPSKAKPALEVSDDSDDAALYPGGSWGMKRAKDRVAYLRANSRTAKRQSEEDSSSRREPRSHNVELRSQPESIISISRAPDQEKKNEMAPSLSASSYRMIRTALSTEKKERESALAAAPPTPDLRYQKFAPVATPPKASSTSTSLDRFSSPAEQLAVPARPEKSVGYNEARSRYETALGQRSTQKTVPDRTSNSARSYIDRSVHSTTPTSVGESASLKSKGVVVQPNAMVSRGRERAALFSGNPGVDAKGVSPRNSWDDGDIPMRSSLSPTPEKKTERSVETRNSYKPSVNNSAVSVSGVNGSLANGVRPWRQQRQESPNQHRVDERRVAAHSTSAPQQRMTNSNKFRAGGGPTRQVPDQAQQRHSLNREV